MKAVDECQTLTHWVNKAVPLAHEQNSQDTNGQQQTLLAFTKKVSTKEGKKKGVIVVGGFKFQSKSIDWIVQPKLKTELARKCRILPFIKQMYFIES